MVSLTARRTVVSVLSAVVAVAVYAAMWLGYRQGWGWLGSFDSSTLNALYDVAVKHPSWVRSWEVVCAVFSPAAVRLLGAAVIVVVVAQRRLRAVLFLLVGVELSGFVMMAAKGLADRPRPVTALVPASSSSFPSGHALTVMVGVLALLAVLLPMMSQPTRRVAVALGVLVVVAVGFGRVALNVHHPSDVLAGWALGYLYFLVCVQLFRPER